MFIKLYLFYPPKSSGWWADIIKPFLSQPSSAMLQIVQWTKNNAEKKRQRTKAMANVQLRGKGVLELGLLQQTRSAEHIPDPALGTNSGKFSCQCLAGDSKLFKHAQYLTNPDLHWRKWKKTMFLSKAIEVTEKKGERCHFALLICTDPIMSVLQI